MKNILLLVVCLTFSISSVNADMFHTTNTSRRIALLGRGISLFKSSHPKQVEAYVDNNYITVIFSVPNFNNEVTIRISKSDNIVFENSYFFSDELTVKIPYTPIDNVEKVIEITTEKGGYLLGIIEPFE